MKEWTMANPAPAYGMRTRRFPDGNTIEFVTCGRCGAYVSDAQTHTDWHRNNDNPF